ncbi:unnamed protein product [Paramecium sonneborni]|uniref:Uncharacterized protein n=1 Tax=Paramecium sonneborni TaxID=65129 RepID=A0A8S1PV07_9CILI|nr:unnamed protein product [Paramecium sonneborni]
MGNMCQNPNIEKQNQRIRLVGVNSQQFPNKQSRVESYTYNIQNNIDKFEEEFYNKNFQFDIFDENTAEDQFFQINFKEEKTNMPKSQLLIEEKITGTHFGSYNQMASEAFMNCIKERQSRKTQKFDRHSEKREQKTSSKCKENSPSIQVRAQLKVTQIDSKNKNTSSIKKLSRHSKNKFQNNTTSNNKTDLKQNSFKLVRKGNIIYY